MELVTMAPRPKPSPTWTDVTVAQASIGSKVVGVVSTGALGRAEGYDDRADALRAARMLTRGAARDAAAVVGYEDRWYVQGVTAVDASWGQWRAPLAFEAALPAMIGRVLINEGTRFNAHLAGLVAIVDGSRSLRIA